MAIDITSNVTGTSLAAMAPSAVRKLWERGALIGEQSTDFFQQMESRSDRGIIWSRTDLGKGKGHEMTFTTMSGFYSEGKVGEGIFEGPNDFESVDMSTFNLKVDFVRNAIRHTERTEEVMGMRGEIASNFNVELGKWLGRKKTEQMLGMFMLKLNTENLLYANGKSQDTLSSADALAWDEVVTSGQALKSLGGLPANIAGASGMAPIWSYNVIATEAALLSLKLDSDYKQVLRDGDVRGRGNTIFKGGYASIDGHTIVPYNPIDHDGKGAIGSFLNAKAYLGGTGITPADTAISIEGGGFDNTGSLTGAGKPLWFKYFPGYDYPFVDTGAFSGTAYPNSVGKLFDAEEKYFLICNISGGDAGKFGMYAYTTGNDGNKITITKRLSATAGTVQKQTVGLVGWNAGVWTGKTTESHPPGSLIVPCNAKGVPFGDTLVLGRTAALRGYGKHRAERRQEDHNGGMIMDRFIVSVFGQIITQDRKGRHPGVMRLRHAITYPGVNFPVVG